MELYKNIQTILETDSNRRIIVKSSERENFMLGGTKISYVPVTSILIAPSISITKIDALNMFMDNAIEQVKGLPVDTFYYHNFGDLYGNSNLLQMGWAMLEKNIAIQNKTVSISTQIHDESLIVPELKEKIVEKNIEGKTAFFVYETPSKASENTLSERVYLKFFPSKEVAAYMEKYGRRIDFKTKYLPHCTDEKFLNKWGGLDYFLTGFGFGRS